MSYNKRKNYQAYAPAASHQHGGWDDQDDYYYDEEETNDQQQQQHQQQETALVAQAQYNDNIGDENIDYEQQQGDGNNDGAYTEDTSFQQQDQQEQYEHYDGDGNEAMTFDDNTNTNNNIDGNNYNYENQSEFNADNTNIDNSYTGDNNNNNNNTNTQYLDKQQHKKGKKSSNNVDNNNTATKNNTRSNTRNNNNNNNNNNNATTRRDNNFKNTQSNAYQAPQSSQYPQQPYDTRGRYQTPTQQYGGKYSNKRSTHYDPYAASYYQYNHPSYYDMYAQHEGYPPMSDKRSTGQQRQASSTARKGDHDYYYGENDAYSAHSAHSSSSAQIPPQSQQQPLTNQRGGKKRQQQQALNQYDYYGNDQHLVNTKDQTHYGNKRQRDRQYNHNNNDQYYQQYDDNNNNDTINDVQYDKNDHYQKQQQIQQSQRHKQSESKNDNHTVKYVPNAIIIKNISRNLTREHLLEIFSTFGQVQSCDISLLFRTTRLQVTIQYDNEDEANHAKEQMDKGNIDGIQIDVERIV